MRHRGKYEYPLFTTTVFELEVTMTTALTCYFFLLEEVFFFNFLFNVYLFLTERERERETEHERGGAEREGDSESEAGSELSAQSPTLGSNSQTLRS